MKSFLKASKWSQGLQWPKKLKDNFVFGHQLLGSAVQKRLAKKWRANDIISNMARAGRGSVNKEKPNHQIWGRDAVKQPAAEKIALECARRWVAMQKVFGKNRCVIRTMFEYTTRREAPFSRWHWSRPKNSFHFLAAALKILEAIIESRLCQLIWNSVITT